MSIKETCRKEGTLGGCFFQGFVFERLYWRVKVQKQQCRKEGCTLDVCLPKKRHAEPTMA
jgi:hypothetical protein